jgi:hypothetical protein
MRQLANDFLACLLVLLLALAGIGAGRHAVPVAAADGLCLTASGPAPVNTRDRHECTDCLAAVVGTLPVATRIVSTAPVLDAVRPARTTTASPLVRTQRPAIRAPPPAA